MGYRGNRRCSRRFQAAPPVNQIPRDLETKILRWQPWFVLTGSSLNEIVDSSDMTVGLKAYFAEVVLCEPLSNLDESVTGILTKCDTQISIQLSRFIV